MKEVLEPWIVGAAITAAFFLTCAFADGELHQHHAYPETVVASVR